MACKVLFFEFGKQEKEYFKHNDLSHYFDIKTHKEALNKETDINENLNEISMISISSKSLITPEILDKFKNLRLISTRTVEFNHIDIKSCFERNIAVVSVEPLNQNTDYYIKNSFEGMKSFLCGGKDNRIV